MISIGQFSCNVAVVFTSSVFVKWREERDELVSGPLVPVYTVLLAQSLNILDNLTMSQGIIWITAAFE